MCQSQHLAVSFKLQRGNELAATQIRVNKQHVFAAFGHVVQNIQTHVRLARAGHKAGESDPFAVASGKGKIGAYRDEEGALHLVTARCPHLGCELTWNPDEKSWDCPCHGSRFDYEGRVLDGPAQEGIGLVWES